MTEPTTWDVQEVVSVTDGDTLRLIRSRATQLGDDWYRITDIRSKPIRLVWVDTPERGDHPGYEQAAADLTEWLHTRSSDLRVVCYASAGWDRLLGDVLDEDGNSASQWLMTVKGWPPYAD